MKQKNNGITLITLAITIVVILMLVNITIIAINGNNRDFK